MWTILKKHKIGTLSNYHDRFMEEHPSQILAGFSTGGIYSHVPL